MKLYRDLRVGELIKYRDRVMSFNYTWDNVGKHSCLVDRKYSKAMMPVQREVK